nr:MAG TPA: hypothetical protein [Caudoviricetes sp.]
MVIRLWHGDLFHRKVKAAPARQGQVNCLEKFAVGNFCRSTLDPCALQPHFARQCKRLLRATSLTSYHILIWKIRQQQPSTPFTTMPTASR